MYVYLNQAEDNLFVSLYDSTTLLLSANKNFSANFFSSFAVSSIYPLLIFFFTNTDTRKYLLEIIFKKQLSYFKRLINKDVDIYISNFNNNISSGRCVCGRWGGG